MRKSHNIEEKQSRDTAYTVPSPLTPEQELLEPSIHSWLQPLLEHAASYLGERVTRDDLDLLSMSLYHLYKSIDSLYCTSLPALTTYLSMNEDREQTYNIWIQLRHIKRTLERIEILCHLLSGTTTSILSGLAGAREQQESKRFSLSPILGARAAAFTQLQKRLEEWQHAFLEQRLLLARLTEQMPPSAQLEIIDKGWSTLLQSARAIFGDILPDIQGISEGDDEAAATLFLDLAQQTDQILLQAEAMLEPFPLLIKQYALPGEV